MKILAITLQNKKGQTLFMVTSNNFSYEQGVRYSNSIYEYIISVSRQGKKVDKTIIIDSAIICICSIIGEIIILVLVSTSQTAIGQEAAKKLCNHFKSNQKIDDLNKKYLLINQILEDFLYTRELNLAKQFQFKVQTGTSDKTNQLSSKLFADCEVFSSFLDMDPQRENKERNSIANIPMKYWIRTQQNIQRIKTIAQQSQDISISTSVAQGKPPVQTKYKTIIEQQRNLCYRYAFKLTTKVATQPKRPANSYQQVSMVPKNQMKFDSISSHDIQGGQQRKNNSVSVQYQNYQKEAITNNITSQTPTSNATTVDLLDMDFFSTATSHQQQQQQQQQSMNNRQQQYQQNIAQKPAQQQIIKQKSSDSNCLDLLDSDDDDDIQPVPIRPAPQTNHANINNSHQTNYNFNSNANTQQVQANPSLQPQQSNRLNSIFGNKVVQNIPLGQQNNSNLNMNQNVQQLNQPQNHTPIPTPSPKPPLGNQQFNYQGINEFNIRILEKLQIIQQDNNFPQGFQLNGQVMIQGDFKDEIILIELKGKNWGTQYVKHRGTPNSMPSRTNKENNAYQIKVDKTSVPQPKPIIDLLMNSQMFLKAQQIPLFFIYQYESQQFQSITFKFQYMVNQKWNHPLFDVEFYIVLDERLIFSDMQHNPIATSYQNKTLLWKTQKLNTTSKGNLVLTLHGINLPPQDILKHIRLQMKSDSILTDLDAQMTVYSPSRQVLVSQNKMVVEYKILPNSK